MKVIPSKCSFTTAALAISLSTTSLSVRIALWTTRHTRTPQGWVLMISMEKHWPSILVVVATDGLTGTASLVQVGFYFVVSLFDDVTSFASVMASNAIKCVRLGRKAATIFVFENLRLSAHGATNYQRAVLLYLLVEGIMSDLFLVAATDGSFIWLQYVSLGYNLSGVLLLLFEMVESMGWLSESYRLFLKRLLFSYESSLLGELLNAIWQSHILTSLNRSDLKQTNSVSLAVSYYLWSLVGHGVIVLCFIGFIMCVRILRAVTYVRWKHGRISDIFWAPCCVDTVYGVRNKMTKLAGYHWENGKLYYKPDALKSFGLLKMEENGSQFLVLNKIHWLKVQTDDLMVIGTVAEKRVEPCTERPCTGVVGFFDRNLGGPSDNSKSPHSITIRVRSKVRPSSSSLSVLPT